MTEKEFETWFIENIDIMTQMNIFHYNAERAREIRSLLTIIKPEIDKLNQKIQQLEKQLTESNPRKRAWTVQVNDVR